MLGKRAPIGMQGSKGGLLRRRELRLPTRIWLSITETVCLRAPSLRYRFITPQRVRFNSTYTTATSANASFPGARFSQ